MTSPSQLSNPEFFLMDRHDADVLGDGVAFVDQTDTFSIVPLIIPVKRITANLVLRMIAVVGGSLVISLYAGKSISGLHKGALLGVAIAIAFSLGIIYLYSYFANKASHRVGPLLVIDKDTGSVILPRQKQVFKKDQVLHLQVLTVPGTGRYLLMKLNEINLLTVVDGRRMRWPILGRVDDYRHVEGVINELLANTDLPVMRYRQYKRKGKLRMEISDMRSDSDRDT